MNNRWFPLLLALGAAGLAVLLLLRKSPEENLQAGFEASCISQNGLLPALPPDQVPAFCSCAASALATEFNPAELDTVLSSGAPSEEQEARASVVLLNCFAEVQDSAVQVLPELSPPPPGPVTSGDDIGI
jgi:hypothetical protein